jgi:hypothetical protein
MHCLLCAVFTQHLQINSRCGSLHIVRRLVSSFLLRKYLTYLDEIMLLDIRSKRRQTNLISVRNGSV